MITEPHTATTDELLDLVAHERRRTVIRCLVEAEEGRVQLEDLVAEVGEGLDAAAPGATQVRIDLHHHHLPKLERAGVLEYDARSGAVRYRSEPRLERVVEFVSREL